MRHQRRALPWSPAAPDRGLTGRLGRAARLALLGALTAGPQVVADPAPGSRPLAQYGIDVWQVEQGLPQNSVAAVRQTPDGYLWLATEEGVARFDGLRFTIFDRANTPALTGNAFWSLHVSRDGRLWLGANSGGLFLYSDGTFRGVAADEGLGNAGVRAIADDTSGTLWVGTTAGLVRLEGERLGRHPGWPADEAVSSLLADRRGRLWVGSSSGLASVSASAPLRRFGAAEGLPEGQVTALAEDSGGRIWAGTAHGLFSFDDGAARFAPHPEITNELIFSLLVDRQGDLWLGTNRGVARLSGGRMETLGPSDGLSSDTVWSLFEDREGAVWVGTLGGGLVRLKAGDFLNVTAREPWRGQRVDTVVAGADDSLWIGGWRGELIRMTPDGRLAATVPPADFEGSDIRSLHVDAKGVLWIGTWLGLYRLEGGRARSVEPLRGWRNVRAIATDRSGVLWVGTDSANAALAELSVTDPLTGLMSRRYLSLRMKEDAAEAVRLTRDLARRGAAPVFPNADLVFLLIDLDHFKSVNDRHGHAAGDAVLCGMRDVLLATMRAADSVVRWGGEELLVVARQTTRSEAPRIAERLRGAVEQHSFAIGGGATLRLTCSIGFAAFPFLPSAPDAVGWLQIVAMADRALYAAKRGGRNAWVGLTATSSSLPESAAIAEPELAAAIARAEVAFAASRAVELPKEWQAAAAAG